MVKEAAAKGFYEVHSFKNQQYPRVQVLTIQALLNGTEKPRYPDLGQGVLTFKQAVTEKPRRKQGELL